MFFFFFFFLQLLICPSDSVKFTTQHQIPPLPKRDLKLQQRFQLSSSDFVALKSIKTALHDLAGSDFFSTWDFSNAASNNPCSTFTGVSCSVLSSDGSGTGPTELRVTSLALGTGLADSLGLAGGFPMGMMNLTRLTQLVLFAGRVSGEIPRNIGDVLTSLRFISITNNLISGSIPNSLSKLSELHTLDLGHNRLSGRIPPGLCSLPNLKVLILASNGYLYGQVPNMVSPLLHIDLRGNSLTGELPTFPTTIRYISASSNYLSGKLDNVSELPNLAFLDLAMNAFVGTIPPSLFSPSIPLLLLHRNYLSGELPSTPSPVRPAPSPESDAVEDLSGGWTVDLSYNQLTGRVTPVLAEAESVYLNNNKFVGVVPSEYSRNVFDGKMKTFYAQHNFITGFDYPLSPGSATLPNSVTVCLAYNCMTLPPIIPTVCPTNTGEPISRPKIQCSVYEADRLTGRRT